MRAKVRAALVRRDGEGSVAVQAPSGVVKVWEFGEFARAVVADYMAAVGVSAAVVSAIRKKPFAAFGGAAAERLMALEGVPGAAVFGTMLEGRVTPGRGSRWLAGQGFAEGKVDKDVVPGECELAGLVEAPAGAYVGGATFPR